MFGLTHAVIVQLLEQLQGAKYCRNYHFEYFTHDHRDTDEVDTHSFHLSKEGHVITALGVISDQLGFEMPP